jgi:DeoR/GlpR family transcriptional regulator of sugar metabolism
MLVPERRRRLLSLIRDRGSVLVTELERKLGVSRMTLYRDIDALLAEGVIEKVHGGVIARPVPETSPLEKHARPLEERLARARPAKQAIARHLARLLRDGGTAVVDNSSTAYYLAEALRQDPPQGELFLVTGGVPLYLELQRLALPGVRPALHGGEPQGRTGTLVGPLALASLQQMRFEFAVMSCLGVLREEGTVFVSNAEEGHLKRAYLERSRRGILAVDSTKLRVSGPYALCELREFDCLVTDHGPEKLRRAGTK